MGTHNRLLAVGSADYPDAYLEIIAIDPGAPPPARPRWFGLDEADFSAGPRLIHVVARSDILGMHRWGLINVGLQPGELIAASRGELSWQIVVRPDGQLPCGGALPTLIEWKGAHPARSMPASGVVLKSLVLRGIPPRARTVLRLPRVEVLSSGTPALGAVLQCPRGEVTLESCMTEDLFREDATLAACEATVVSCGEEGIVLDRTVFYPLGGGQAGDAGTLQLADGRTIAIADTRKHKEVPGAILHLPAPGADLSGLAPGTPVTARIDEARRMAHRRFHTATHLLCALIPHPVDGCSITAGYARLDFHMAEPLDKDALTEGIARYVAGAHPVRHRWISEAELDANPQLVRSMSVQPPRGLGRVRVIDIEGVDLQPCGGTHVANTAEIGRMVVTKIEKKSAMTRSVVLGFADLGEPRPIKRPPRIRLRRSASGAPLGGSAEGATGGGDVSSRSTSLRGSRRGSPCRSRPRRRRRP